MTSMTAPLEAVAVSPVANQPVPGHVVLTRDLNGLSRVHAPGVNLVIWEREMPHGLIAFLDALKPGRLPNETRTVATVQARAAVAGFVAQLWPEPTLGRQLLCHDVSNLVETFAQITGARRVRITLDGRQTPITDRFTAGDYRLRMETTYRGPGLEWLPNESVDRDLLDTGSDTLVCDDPSALRAIGRFNVALVKGERYARSAGHSLITRHPEMPRLGTDRLTVRLDEDL